MAKHHLLLVAAILLSTTAASPTITTVVNSTTPTAYEMLQQYGLPRGILPEGVQDYVLHPDGSFEASLPADCEVTVVGYNLRYRSHLSGTIQSGSIDKLDGVSVKVLFAWVGIEDVNRDGDQVKFHAGPVTKSFALSNFAESPRCQ